jgi:ornithine cyclodeaminase/alanine dehydrogenase-like protein (mu-crystallin family)
MLEAMVYARKFQQIKVLNTRPERLAAYCAEMSERLGTAIVPATDASDAIADADVTRAISTGTRCTSSAMSSSARCRAEGERWRSTSSSQSV